jgi:hypothetical protein
MGSLPLGYSSCEHCHGRGRKDNGTPCPNCKGAGVLAVYPPQPNYAERTETRVQDRPQRRFPRYLTDLPLTANFSGRRLEGSGDQISEGGVRAVLPELVPVETVVALQFAVPGHPTALHVPAVVRYHLGFHHGLVFLSLDETQRAAIRQFCSELPSVH